MVRWTLKDTLAFLLLLSLLLPSLLIMFIPSTFKRPVSSWKALNLRKTLLMASSVRLKPLNCSRLPCVYAQETLTFLLTRYGSSHIGATAKDISNVVTDAASGVVDIFHGIDKAVADTWNNFWKDGKADGIGSNLSRK